MTNDESLDGYCGADPNAARKVLEKQKCCDDCPGDDTCDNAKYCMCGSRMEDHDIGSGHSPVSMHDYYSSQNEKAAADIWPRTSRDIFDGHSNQEKQGPGDHDPDL